jgi:hypothetical protein
MLMEEEKRLRWCGIDLRARWRRRVLVVATCALYFVGLAWGASLSAPYHAGFWVMLTAQAWLLLFSVFRDGGPVKTMGDRPRMVMVRGLDDWARYRSGVSFDELSEEQQKALLSRYRIGNFLVPARFSRDPRWPDEREQKQRERVTRHVANWLPGVVSALAGQYAWKRQPIDGVEVGAMLLMVVATMRVGTGAVILWEEPEPLEDGELRLVGEKEA